MFNWFNYIYLIQFIHFNRPYITADYSYLISVISYTMDVEIKGITVHPRLSDLTRIKSVPISEFIRISEVMTFSIGVYT